MVQHDVVKTIDRVVEVGPGREIIHEEKVDSSLRPLKVNMISLWNVTDSSGRFVPAVRVIEGRGGPNMDVRVELWSVSLKNQKLEDMIQSPSYAKPLQTALSEAIAVNRSRTYIRFVASDVSSSMKVHIRVKVAVDVRRLHNSWQHVRHAVILRESGILRPGESRVVPRI